MTEAENMFLARFGPLKHIDHILDSSDYHNQSIVANILKRDDIKEHHVKKILENFKTDNTTYITPRALRHRALSPEFIQNEIDHPNFSRGLEYAIVKNPNLTSHHIDQILANRPTGGVLENLPEHPNLQQHHMRKMMELPNKKFAIKGLSSRKQDDIPHDVLRQMTEHAPEQFGTREDLTPDVAEDFLAHSIKQRNGLKQVHVLANPSLQLSAIDKHLKDISPSAIGKVAIREDLKPEHFKYLENILKIQDYLTPFAHSTLSSNLHWNKSYQAYKKEQNNEKN